MHELMTYDGYFQAAFVHNPGRFAGYLINSVLDDPKHSILIVSFKKSNNAKIIIVLPPIFSV